MPKGGSAERFRRSRRGSEGAASASDTPPGRRFAGLGLVGAALVGAVLLGFLIVRYSVANALLQVGPQFAAAVAPDHPRVVLAGALEELQLRGAATAPTERASVAAFSDAPLSEVPLLIAARKALSAGQDARAEPLIAAAVRRNPRSRFALLLRLDQEVRLGKVQEAAATMAILTRASPNSRSLLTAQLAIMAADPATRRAVRGAIGTDAQLRAGVLEQLARRGADAAIVLELAGDVRPTPPGAQAPAWQRLLIENMVERGQVAEAHRVWVRLSGADLAAVRSGIYDRDFAGLPGPPPFNWHLQTGTNGFAERTQGGLEVQYDGRDTARLASQLLLLPPGTYHVSFTAGGDAPGENGRLAWTVACHPGGQPIVIAEIAGVEFNPKRITGQFTVPPTRCPGQWLRLVGNSAEFPEDQQVTIRELRIEGGGLR